MADTGAPQGENDDGRRVSIYEVGPRDGLQNEAEHVPTRDKIALIDALSRAGFSHIEATSFVSPKWVPQLADAADVMAGIGRADGVRYAVLAPNMRGLEAARKAGADEVAVFAAASQTFSRKNINCTIEESIERFRPVARAAGDAGMTLRGYVSCAIACPYEGAVDPRAVRDVTEALFELGCQQVSLGDTIGRGAPGDVKALLDVMAAEFDAGRLAGHFHDTSGQAVANVMASLDYGMRVFDAAIGGLGGCPFAPGAKGNVDTRRLVAALHGAGWSTGLDDGALDDAERLIRGITMNGSEG